MSTDANANKTAKTTDYGPWWGEITMTCKRDNMPVWKYWLKNKESLIQEFRAKGIEEEADIFARAMWRFLHMSFEEKREFYTLDDELKRFHEKGPESKELQEMIDVIQSAGKGSTQN